MSMIEVRGLTKRFGPVLAVDQMSFEVDQGTITGFLGSNGAGKTTTLRMLLGGAAFGPAHNLSGGSPLPFAAATTLLAALAIVFCAVAARTTVGRDVT